MKNKRFQSQMSTSKSDMINLAVVDGNLYFNAALKANLLLEDIDNNELMFGEVMTMRNKAIETYERKYSDSNDTPKPINSKESIAVIITIWSGSMRKECELSQSWKKRWFVLKSDGTLLCYNNEKSKHLMHEFVCRNLTEIVSKSWSQSSQSSKNAFGIQINTSGAHWKLLCQNNNDRNEWIKAFQTVSNAKHVW